MFSYSGWLAALFSLMPAALHGQAASFPVKHEAYDQARGICRDVPAGLPTLGFHRVLEGCASVEPPVPGGEPAGLTRAARATLNVLTPRSKDGMMSGSGVVVSRHGYVLTAAHVAAACLGEQGPRRAAFLPGPRVKGVQIVDQSGAYGCGGLFIEGLTEPARARLIYAGRGFAMAIDARKGLAGNDVAVLRTLLANDFMILKLDLEAATASLACAPAALEDPVPGDMVWALGFPGKTTRGALDSDGESRYLSRGRVRASYADNEVLRRVIPSAIEPLRAAYETPELIISDVDVAMGSSGGLLMDASGRLVGINNSMLIAGTPFGRDFFWTSERYIPNNAVSLKISSIRRQVGAVLGAAAAAEIFDCP